jgi:hypothetical protein
VIVSSTEDTEAETLTPSLTLPEADMGEGAPIHLHRAGLMAVSRFLTTDILRDAIQQIKSIDPRMSHLSATLNGWNDQEFASPHPRLLGLKSSRSDLRDRPPEQDSKDAIDRIGGSVGI